MPEKLDDFLMNRPPTADRPLLGQTVLVIEDSRFASEALRLMCLRSGARVRRADCLRTAARHLATYRPSVVVIDLGLPDGSGIQLIDDLAQSQPRIPVILATSGDDTMRADALAAGADGFLPKPLSSLSIFQETILERLPNDARPKGLRLVTEDRINPDRIALQDDLAHAAAVLSKNSDAETITYLAQFLSGLARSANDKPLEEAAQSLASCISKGSETAMRLRQIEGLMEQRLQTKEVV
jgi:DNA-binding response OmpR family regulator